MLLAGDCRQQLAKQKYLTNKQNKVVELLIQQLSRLLVGWMLMQLETHQHQMLSHRLAQCNTRLGHEVAEVRSRNESLRAANSTLRKPKTPKAVIDNRDAAMLGVYHSLVSKQNEDSIFKTFAAAQNAAEKLKEYASSLTRDQKLSVIPSSLQNLVNTIQECYELNLDSNSDEFILTPPEVHAGQTTLLELLSTIRELAAQELAKVEKKKSFIQLDSDAAAARNLWVNRFLNPKGDVTVSEGQINS
uniref:HAUS augmin-like complex subunit 3 N-terminal domain-containing protein n=1 Tax=Ciona savignyi TaxID=51511 RepID=H2Z250_CIOSA